MNLIRLSIMICMTCVMCLKDAYGATFRSYGWEVIQGLAQSSDLVVTGKILDVNPGLRGNIQPDESYAPSTDTHVTCSVEYVHIGSSEISSGDTITILFTAADCPIRKESDAQLLLFLKKEGNSYRLPFWEKYGVFPLDGKSVKCWLKGKERGEYFTLDEVLTKVKKYKKYDVDISVAIDSSQTSTTNNLQVIYSFRNNCSSDVYVIPPSHCFNSLQCRKLTNGQWFPKKNPWDSVNHWKFISTYEPLFLIPGKSTEFLEYKIPFCTLGIDEHATYRIISYCRQYRHSNWCDENTQTITHDLIWLGVPDKEEWEIEIKPDSEDK